MNLLVSLEYIQCICCWSASYSVLRMSLFSLHICSDFEHIIDDLVWYTLSLISRYSYVWTVAFGLLIAPPYWNTPFDDIECSNYWSSLSVCAPRFHFLLFSVVNIPTTLLHIDTYPCELTSFRCLNAYRSVLCFLFIGGFSDHRFWFNISFSPLHAISSS